MADVVEQLRALVKEAQRQFSYDDTLDEHKATAHAKRWVEDHAPQLAELVADMGEALRDLFDDLDIVAGQGVDALARLDALFSEEDELPQGDPRLRRYVTGETE